ncbi:molybdopterin molybdotransferase MoeA [Formicincola oecophyllae]|uniref:Molybdopterin molybdenumtransferase n=1 Tax=Formicincola oecophyllae TaxID=2558361 RepID=A0A4Y6UC20_9PROT|nr:molybdopterin molybdotransferase MoeA [Formicincola oecophyllae]QDH13665.1 molybdopterin molybdotransferase MoeA [Formicincola oecophyllae]
MAAPLSVTEAAALVAEHAGDFGIERVSLLKAPGRILRETIHAERDQPPFDRVMMDGIACRLVDVRAEALMCTGTVAAGAKPLPLGPTGTCLAVMTGAVMPQGAECVIPVEQIERHGSQVRVLPQAKAVQGQHVHDRGLDAKQGDVLLAAGLHLGAPALAVLASNAKGSVLVSRRPRVAILATGDELVDVEGPIEPWQVRRSNDCAIEGSLRVRGVEEIAASHVPDDERALERSLGQALAERDIVLLSGGVSMGQFDYVPQALAALGVVKVFHRVAQKPGAPLWFGIGPQGQRVFGLPGNPLAVMACMARYVGPLLALASKAQAQPQLVHLAAPAPRHGKRTLFMPAHLQRDGSVMPRPQDTSGDFMHLSSTDGIIVVPSQQEAGADPVPVGATVPFYGW